MTPYRPSGKTDPGALPVLLLATLGGGILAGIVLHFIGQFIHLLVIWPAIMGGAAGAIAAMMARKKRVRAPVAVALIAAVGGLSAWVTDLAFDYPPQRAEIHDQISALAAEIAAETGETIPESRVDTVVDALFVGHGADAPPAPGAIEATLFDETIDGQAPLTRPGFLQTFIGWAKVQAREGITISRTGSSDGIALGYVGTLVLWLVELLIAAGLGAIAGSSAAREPFCETCNAWYGAESGLVPVAPAKEKKAVLAALGRGDVGALGATVPAIFPAKFLALGARRCGTCGADVYVRVVQVTEKKAKAEQTDVKAGLVTSAAFDAMLAEIERAAAAGTPQDATEAA